MSGLENDPAIILERLHQLRAADAPTHGGRVLSYVYDSGMAEIDELAAAAMRAVQPVNGLDPTTFTSVAVMERELIGFARRILHGEAEAGTESASTETASTETVVGTVTSGGTESCLLAVKTARDDWRAAGGFGRPRLVAPVTAHAAFHKAAHYFDLELALVPVDPETGVVSVEAMIAAMCPRTALVVVSAPSYPFAGLDPITEVAAAAAERGVCCHVDACIGGLALPWWPNELAAWDFRVPGVTSISADLHKYGYSPKGVSVLLQRGRDLARTQYFATTRWPGYPVVNPTLLGSKSAAALAAAWAIVHALGDSGFARLTAQAARATDALHTAIDAIEGLRVFGDPVGPLLAVCTDTTVALERRVDPHHWADRMRGHGFVLQLQPGFVQPDGTHLPHTTHLTVTPVTEARLPELLPALAAAADEIRGTAPVDPDQVLTALGGAAVLPAGPLTSDAAWDILQAIGLAPSAGKSSLPESMAPFLALVEALPAALSERLLIELLARIVEPT